MGGLSNWPSFNQFISECWGWSNEVNGPSFLGASNVVVGTNPPVYPDGFLQFYPRFGGTPLVTTGTTTQGSNVITAVASTSTTILVGCPGIPAIVTAGQLLTSAAFPPGTLVTAVTPAPNGTITVSNPALSTGTAQLTIYVNSYVPLVVIMAFLALASASLVQARWLDTWTLGLYLFTAHYCTLYLRSNGNIYSTAGQAATAGLAVGITVSKGAGPVNQGLQVVGGLEDWGAWQQTAEGTQFATLAKCIGGGPMLLY